AVGDQLPGILKQAPMGFGFLPSPQAIGIAKMLNHAPFHAARWRRCVYLSADETGKADRGRRYLRMPGGKLALRTGAQPQEDYCRRGQTCAFGLIAHISRKN